MGCWNETCGISKLPIFYGDDVIVMMMKQSTYGSRCYTTAFWEPIGFPIYAKYNDYGWIDNALENPFLDWTLQLIDKNLVELEIGENKVHDIAVERGRMNIEYLGALVHEDRLNFQRNYQREKGLLPVSAMMIRRDVYEGMIAGYSEKIRVTHETDKGFHYEDIRSDHFTKVVRSKYKAIVTKFGACDDTRVYFPSLRSYEMETVLRPFERTFEFVENYPQHIDRYISELGRMLTINALMGELRLDYGLSQGAGSQNGDMSLYKRQNQLIGSIIDARIVEEKSWNNDDDEDAYDDVI